MNSVRLKSPNPLILIAVSLASAFSLHAQFLSLEVTSSPALVTTNSVLTFEMVLRNETSQFRNSARVAVSFSETIDFVSATNNAPNGSVQAVGSSIVYDIPALDALSEVDLSLQIFGVVPGFLTNYFDYSANGIPVQSEDVVVQIFSADADLAVSLVSPTNTVIAGDWMTYRLMITNQGPDAVDAVVVTTAWSPGSDFVSMNPSVPRTITGDKMVFSTGAIATDSETFFDITIQPNQAGQGELTADLFVDNLLDRNPDDNVSTNTITIGEAVPASLDVSIISGQTFNPQTGLMEQTIRLTNNGTTNVASSRVLIDAFPEQVHNAAGTNNSIPFVTLTRALGPGESADLVLEYFVPSRTAIENPVFSGLSVPEFVPSAPSGESVAIDASFDLGAGSVLIEFAAVPQKNYFVLYSENASFANAYRALPAIAAPATRVQWIDAGPPKTTTRPGDVSTRFYRVIEVPQ